MKIVRVEDVVMGRDPVASHFESCAAVLPTRIVASYWLTSNGWESAGAAVYGYSVVSRLPCKSVFWVDTLGRAPLWVRDFVAVNAPEDDPR